jgi:hypothetical protein
MDDIIIATPDDKKLHEEIVCEVLKVLQWELLFLKAKKCHFEQREMEFLGYLIMEGTLKINPTKQHGLEEWPRVLKSVKDVCSMLGECWVISSSSYQTFQIWHTPSMNS